MRDAAVDRDATPPRGDAEDLEGGGADGLRAEKPTIVNLPKALLASERGPRTVRRDTVRTEPDFECERHIATAPDLDLRGPDEDAIVGETAVDEEFSEERGLVIDNRYVVESLIARGGMGVVYRCRHKAIGKELAVKIIRKDIAKLAEAPQRLLIEAQAASAIGNEHIIDIRDFGALADGSAYLVMELLDGVPLSELIARHETLPLARILSIGTQIAEGLQAAHAAGIVHRDLKPENIFLLRRKADDFVKILDFGIAKMRRAEPLNLTRTGVIVGTPDYMSPEQAAGAPIDHRVDIYSLGVILYELAAGRVPFYGSNYMGLLTKIVTEPAPPFRALIPPPPVPPEFEAIVMKCLSKRPGQRFYSMTELIEALQGIQRLIGVPVPTGNFAVDPMLGAEHPSHGASPSRPSSLYSIPAASGRSVVETSRRATFGINSLGVGLLVLSIAWLWHVRRTEPVSRLEPIVVAPAVAARSPAVPTTSTALVAAARVPAEAPLVAPVLVDTPGPLVVVTPYVAPVPAEDAPAASSDEKPAPARKRSRKQRRLAAQPAEAPLAPPPTQNSPEQRSDDDLLNPWPARH